MCEKFLKAKLVVDTDYEIENDGDPIAYKTEDSMFFFVPQLDDPVMSHRTLVGNEKPIPGRFKYSIEIVKSDGGSYWEPPSYDQAEIGRANSLSACIEVAAHYLLDLELDNVGESEFWGIESIMEKEYPTVFKDLLG
jgi:hypothetical protein